MQSSDTYERLYALMERNEDSMERNKDSMERNKDYKHIILNQQGELSLLDFYGSQSIFSPEEVQLGHVKILLEYEKTEMRYWCFALFGKDTNKTNKSNICNRLTSLCKKDLNKAEQDNRSVSFMFLILDVPEEILNLLEKAGIKSVKHEPQQNINLANIGTKDTPPVRTNIKIHEKLERPTTLEGNLRKSCYILE